MYAFLCEAMIKQTTSLPDPSLIQLSIICQQEMNEYIRLQRGNSVHCFEIVRQAAQGNSDALGVLLNEITRIMIAKKYRKEYRATEPFTLDDLQQAVFERLINKFRNKKAPYKATTFAAYYRYVNTTTYNLANNWFTRGPHSREISLDADMLQPSDNSQSKYDIRRYQHQRIILQLTDLVSDPLIHEVLRLRIGYSESVGNILQILQPRYPELTIKKLYRLIAKGMRQIKNHPDFSRIYDDYKSM